MREAEEGAGSRRPPSRDGDLAETAREVSRSLGRGSYFSEALYLRVLHEVRTVFEEDRTRLLNELERRAEERGLERLYLLAGADQGFFQAQGYQIVSHWEIPEDLRFSGEGSRLRPSDAVPMRKRIGASVRTVAAA